MNIIKQLLYEQKCTFNLSLIKNSVQTVSGGYSGLDGGGMGMGVVQKSILWLAVILRGVDIVDYMDPPHSLA